MQFSIEPDAYLVSVECEKLTIIHIGLESEMYIV